VKLLTDLAKQFPPRDQRTISPGRISHLSPSFRYSNTPLSFYRRL
jgi:hypothetical protein